MSRIYEKAAPKIKTVTCDCCGEIFQAGEAEAMSSFAHKRTGRYDDYDRNSLGIDHYDLCRVCAAVVVAEFFHRPH